MGIIVLAKSEMVRKSDGISVGPVSVRQLQFDVSDEVSNRDGGKKSVRFEDCGESDESYDGDLLVPEIEFITPGLVRPCGLAFSPNCFPSCDSENVVPFAVLIDIMCMITATIQSRGNLILSTQVAFVGLCATIMVFYGIHSRSPTIVGIYSFYSIVSTAGYVAAVCLAFKIDKFIMYNYDLCFIAAFCAINLYKMYVFLTHFLYLREYKKFLKHGTAIRIKRGSQ